MKKYDDDYIVQFTELEEQYLKFISNKLSSGKRIQELETIRLAIEKKSNLMNYLKEEMKNTYNITIPDVGYETIRNILTQNFASGTGKDTYKDIEVLDKNDRISPIFSKLLLNEEFKRQVLEVIDYAIDQYHKKYSKRYKDTDLCLYEKYTYEDICRLLNWEKNLNPQNISGYFYHSKTKTLPVFINYHKSDGEIAYQDRFVSPSHIIALSKHPRNVDSKDADHIYKRKETDKNNRIFLFIKKNKKLKDNRKKKDDDKEFYFLGEIEALGDPTPIFMESTNDNAFEISYKLDTPVRKDIYDYIVNN